MRYRGRSPLKPHVRSQSVKIVAVSNASMTTLRPRAAFSAPRTSAFAP